ncbi:G-type lectin S-receptor-like serine/threonine-protein kinase, partial [Mucuna pruriens]
MGIFCLMIIVAHMLVASLTISAATLNVSQSISDGKTLLSNKGVFELGFFSPGNSTKRYLGIWYKNIPKESDRVVWVANGANPINDSSGILKFNSTGNLELIQNNTVVWYATYQKQAQNPVAEFLENGNLVVRNEGVAEAEGYLWQSFDYPSDTLLPGMKLGWDLRTGLERKITCWKSPDDPSPGNFSWSLVLNSYPEFYLMNGILKFSRTGPWNGLHFSGVSNQNPNRVYEFKYVAENDPMYASNKVEMFYEYTLKNSSAIARLKIKEQIFLTQVWDLNWTIYEWTPRDQCDMYEVCGAHATCSITRSPMCQCLKGFMPKSPQKWNEMDWSGGCVRNKSLRCKDNYPDEFITYGGLKVPDTTHTSLDENIDLDECRDKCLNDCSCMAFTNSNISGAGSGCVIWFGDLLDIGQEETGGQDLYIRMAASDLYPLTEHGHSKRVTIIIATTIAAFKSEGTFLFQSLFMFHNIIECLIPFFHWAEKSKTKDIMKRQLEDLDLPLFDLLTITTATNKFSSNNKIGQGGFGPVYKGKLVDGQDIAVKRLSRSSGQGITEFITEVKLIAKLQHRNLVKLLGCCIQGQEKILVYEFMVNGSLHSFIFDQTKRKFLDWPRRFQIIFGVARGLLYLHQDSRLRIIHRDLKASNVLLDDKLNPKISDFGMARAFGGDQTEGNTNRVVGTFGYMAPEYAVDGLFSIKSDVFSFGILLLEIVCGNKNRALCHKNQTLNLVGYAWTLWKEKNALQLIDSSIKDSCVIAEVLRCIHVSLLCVQQYPEDRPNMTSVIQMLGSEMELVEPKEPAILNVSLSISDGETLVSNRGTFELGFFSPGNSTKRYLGIWYKNIPKESDRVVWVANGANPINDSSGILKFNSTGNLELIQNNTVVWYATYQKQAQNPVAEFLENGNLVVRNEGVAEAEEYLWQSFDYPSDTLLPGMKLGWDLRTDFERKLTSWKGPDDPSPGIFSWRLMLYNYPEFYLMRGAQKYHRIGPWNGLQFNGLSDQFLNPFLEFEYIVESDLMYASNTADMFYEYTLRNSAVIARVKIMEGSFQNQVWEEDKADWRIYESTPQDLCDIYGRCGAYGICTITGSPLCKCLKGFIPKSSQEWNAGNWSQGCVRKKPLSCKGSQMDEFVKYEGMKVPDTTHTWLDMNIDLDGCRDKCLNDCSCMAFTNSDIREGGSGCVIWLDHLFDIKLLQTGGGQNLYIRVSASDLDKTKTKENIKRQLEDLDVPMFDLITITSATNNFSLNNKIGQGGFGPVYKGKLADGREIAVKRLSSSSRQGIAEFITEVELIAKLQHRNLVMLLGCCIGRQEKILVYEFMVNGSLHSFIFGMGLLYLHRDSRFRIIHRDLKASNVLLDEKLNPKISDFGMARAFGGDETEGNTNRIVGTYGYMAPEYAVDGLFSIKSDVFSFGILLLEIVCGNKNRALCHKSRTLNLVGYAWSLWKEQNALQLIDSSIKDSCVISEVLRCIHVSLLCVQQNPEDRPTMTSVIQMLGSEMQLFEPKEPGFFPRKTSNEGTLSTNINQMTSNDELTITSLNGRSKTTLSNLIIQREIVSGSSDC